MTQLSYDGVLLIITVSLYTLNMKIKV